MSRLVFMSGLAAALSLCLANAALYETPVDVSPIEIAAGASKGNEDTKANSFKSAELGAFTETIERPLFNPNRRRFVSMPVPPPAAVVADQPPPVESPVSAAPAPPPAILGVSMANGEARALLRVGDSPQWVRKGETIGDWTIEEIAPSDVSLRRRDEVTKVSLYPEKATADAR